MISFRLTAEDYERFREMCLSCGTRSVSELARAAINSLLNQQKPAPQETLEYRVMELEGSVNMLRSEFKRLRERESSQVSEDSATKVRAQLSS
jgi:hypothetical protein